MARFLDDRPIRSFDHDLLWPQEKSIRDQIENIGRTIVAPLAVNAEPSESLTFAVHGAWGMGKSSALQLIKATALQEAGDEADRLCFIEYSAPAHEAMVGFEQGAAKGGRSVPVTLALRIIQALAGDTDEEQAAFLVKYLNYAFTMVPKEAFAESDLATWPKVFQELSVSLSNIIDFDRIISRLMLDDPSAADSKRKVIVILVDDLDRCQPSFVWDVLNTIQQWSGIRNLFIVLAVDRSHLNRAIESRPGVEQVTADYALEKYIQHSITVPLMDQAAMEAYISALNRDDDDLADVLAAFGRNADLMHFGLSVQSPRSVKRCINTLSQSLKQHLVEVGSTVSDLETRRVIKELIVQYTWNSFYESAYLPAKRTSDARSNSPIYLAFRTLEDPVCLDYAATGDEPRLRFELERISKQTDVSWSALPKDLARFLGLRPFFFGEDEADAHATRPSRLVANLERASGARSEPRLDVSIFNAMLFDIERETLANNIDQANRIARRVIELVQANFEFLKTTNNHGAASIIGDIASSVSISEFPDTTLAERLWDLALQFEGTPRVQANNMQRFAAMIIARGLSGLYDLADEMVSKLGEPPLDEINVDTTKMLIGGLALVTGASEHSSIDPDEVDVSEGPNFLYSMALFQSEGKFDSLIKLGRRRYRSVDTPDDAYAALRVTADGLGSGDDEALACDIYRFILAHYVERSAEAKDDVPDIQHNLATHLNGMDYVDEAGRLWSAAYKGKSADQMIQRSYARYLSRAKRPDLAAAVARGEYIDEEVLIPSRKVLPDKHSNPYPDWLLDKPWFRQ